EKEMQWLVADDPIVSGKGDSALDYVLGPQGALRPERLDALVIAIDRTPAVRDLEQRTRLRAQCHHRRVDIACFADRRVDQHARLGAAAVEVERLFAKHRLAGACRGFDKIGMGVGRAGNHDRLYGAVGKSLRLSANSGAVAAG